MNYEMHMFVTPRRGAPMEDLGIISVSPKPTRARAEYLRGWPPARLAGMKDERPAMISCNQLHRSRPRPGVAG